MALAQRLYHEPEIGEVALISGLKTIVPHQTLTSTVVATKPLSIIEAPHLSIFTICYLLKVTASGLTIINTQSRNYITMAVLTIFGVIIGVIVFFMILAGFVGWMKTRQNAARYGPRLATPGRPRRTRTKGLALAVLDSIPIVKFGTKNKHSDVVTKDIELGERHSTVKGDLATATVAGSNNTTNESRRVGATELDQSSKTAVQTTFDENQCAICISDFIADEEVRVLPCNHRYHPECIDPWLLNISGTCPIW